VATDAADKPMQGQWRLSSILMLVLIALTLLAAPCGPGGAKKEQLAEKQLLAVLDCITRPGVLSIPKDYSGNCLRFRYAYGSDRPGRWSAMGLMLYKAGGERARYYMFFLDWSKQCPAVHVSNGADLYREGGRWHSDIPFRVGGLGTMEAFAELPNEYAKERVRFVPARRIKRTCATFDDGT
jgi:hypothetical protein